MVRESPRLRIPRRFIAFLLVLSHGVQSCGLMPTSMTESAGPTRSAQAVELSRPAFETGNYPNLFVDYLGKDAAQVQARIEAVWDQLFYGDDTTERVYYPVGADMAYILDTGNGDVRSEGMSYGMMIAVQLNKKEEFDRIWKWAKTYMYQTDGGYKGYFAWHCTPDGDQLDANPASDGEEWFITALLFADARWGSGQGIFDYRSEAQAILDVALHADQLAGDLATNLFDLEARQVVFVPQLGKNSTFTDPSYHLPHYYELWARWAANDNAFWEEAARVSRAYLQTAVHPQTGLAPNYSYFDGSPYDDPYNGNFRYDAFRVGANIGVDHMWFAADPWQVEQSNRMLDFFASQGLDEYKAEYLLSGEPQAGHRSPGLIATNAVAALAADPAKGFPFVQALWDLETPTGQYRYYDGLLMLLALLQVSGNFRIYQPGSGAEASAFPTAAPEVGGVFVPPAGRVLLLVGQEANSVDAYFDMTVTAPGGVALDASVQMEATPGLEYLATKYPNSVLFLGLDLSGLTDAISEAATVEAMFRQLDRFERPVFLRLRPGLEDSAGGDEREAYLAIWDVLHQHAVAADKRRVALVWEYESCDATTMADRYPGDDLVDWISLPYCEGQQGDNRLTFARTHLKPVMLTAGMPAEHSSWDAWYAPLFVYIRENNDVVRAVTYLNEVQGGTGMNEDVLALWKEETRQVLWLQASPSLFDTLGYAR